MVVIGILIALQINNWNEHCFEKIETRSYLSNIEKRHTDIESLNDLINYNINQSKDIDAFYKHISLNRRTIASTLESSLLSKHTLLSIFSGKPDLPGHAIIRALCATVPNTTQITSRPDLSTRSPTNQYPNRNLIDKCTKSIHHRDE